MLTFVTFFVALPLGAREPKTIRTNSVTELPSREHRWALVIGVGKYNDGKYFPTLSGDRDAKIIAKALVKYAGFPRSQVILLVNDNKNPLYRPIYASINYWLNEILRNVSPNDVWLIAYSGHGVHLDASPQSPGGDFLIPSDATGSPSNPFYLTSEMISLETVKGYLRLSEVRQTILLLDLCRDTFSPGRTNVIQPNPLSTSAIRALDYARISPSLEASAVLFSTSANHSAYQDHSHNLGFFSEYFVNGLAGDAVDSNGTVTLSSLIKYIRERIPERAHHQFFEEHVAQPSQQVPDIYLSGYKSDRVVLTELKNIDHGRGEGHAALALAAEPIEISNDVSGPIFSAPTTIPIGGKFPNSVAVADFNGDGKKDIVTANQNSNDVSVLLGNGDGSFQQPARRFAAGDSPYTVAVGDFNGDGKQDIAVANIGYNGAPSISILLGRGDGTFENARNFPSNDQPTKIVAVDLNGDGKLDLVVGNRTLGTASVLFGRGDGTFQMPISYHTDLAPYSVAVGVLTSTDNARPDLVVANGDGHSLSVLLNKGNGTFKASENYPVDTGCWGASSVRVGDFDSDGKLDLVMSDFSNSTVGFLQGNGDGTFQGRTVRFPLGSDSVPVNDDCSDFKASSSSSVPTVGPFDLVVEDFNGDGKLDVATANNNNSVTVLLGNGDGTFQAPKAYPGEESPCSIAAADFDGDGRPDVVTANRAGDSVSILMNISNQTNLRLTAAQNPAKFGTDIEFTAKVSTDFGPALGYVVFKSDNYILGRIPLENGVATVDTYALKTGSHTITAQFVGSAQFGGSSATIVQTVTPAR